MSQLPADLDLRRRVELITGADGPAPVVVCTPFGPHVCNHILRGSGEQFGLATGAGVRTEMGRLGLGAGATSAATDAFRLHSTANAANTVWEAPVGGDKVTVLAYLVRYSNSDGNAPIFANNSPLTSPFAIWALIDSIGTGQLRFELNAGGALVQVTAPTVMPNNQPLVCVGVYNGAAGFLFINGALVASVAASGAIGNVSAVDRGPAIGNFYNYVAGTRTFRGDVHVAALWDQALTQQQVAQITARLLGPRRLAPARFVVPAAAAPTGIARITMLPMIPGGWGRR